MLLAHIDSSSAEVANTILPNFLGWQFVVAFLAVAGVLAFLTMGVSVAESFFGRGGGDLMAPYKEYQKVVNTSSAFFALVVSFSAAIITNQLTLTVIIVGTLMFFWVTALGTTIDTFNRRKRQRVATSTINAS